MATILLVGNAMRLFLSRIDRGRPSFFADGDPLGLEFLELWQCEDQNSVLGYEFSVTL